MIYSVIVNLYKRTFCRFMLFIIVQQRTGQRLNLEELNIFSMHEFASVFCDIFADPGSSCILKPISSNSNPPSVSRIGKTCYEYIIFKALYIFE